MPKPGPRDDTNDDNLYRLLVEQASDGIVIYDQQGVILEANARACEMSGYPREEMVGRTVTEFIAPDDLERTPLRTDALRDGQPVLGERIILRRDGTRLPVELSARMLSDGRIHVLVRDITRQKLAEEKIRYLNSRLEQRVAERTARLRDANRALRAEVAERRNAEERYRTLAHAVTSVVWTTDPQGAFITPQDEWEQYTGQPWEQHKGWGWLDMIHPDDREAISARWKTAVAERSVYASEGRLWNAERGEYRHYFARAAPVLNSDGSIREWIGTIRDVHERKLVEQERDRLLHSEQEARIDAEAAVRTRDELLAIVSHDLKNPLAAIKGNSQLLWRRLARMGVDEGERLTSLLKRIDEAASRMNLLISDLMDFGRLQAGQSLSLQRRAVDLVMLARNVAHELQNTTNTHHIHVTPDVESLVGMWDGPRIEQLLSNLLSNAIKYSPNGGRVTVRVHGREDGRAALSVSDHGLGIPPHDLPYIFEWFRRAHDTSGRISGAGIGLASARYIAREHGGDIEVESVPGEGSTFTLVLPVDPPEDAPH
jgi:PAS domain S-box-containing protein